MSKIIGFRDLVTHKLDHKLASCHLLYAIAKLIGNKTKAYILIMSVSITI